MCDVTHPYVCHDSFISEPEFCILQAAGPTADLIAKLKEDIDIAKRGELQCRKDLHQVLGIPQTYTFMYSYTCVYVFLYLYVCIQICIPI